MSAVGVPLMHKIVSSLSSRQRISFTLDKLKVIAESARTLAGSIQDRPLKKRVENFHNRTVSLCGGLESLDYTELDLVAYRAKALSFLQEVHEQTSLSRKQVAKIKASWDNPEDEAVEEDAAATTYKVSSDQKMDSLFKGSEQTLERYRSYSAIVKSLNGKDFVIHRAPIIPMSTPPIQFEKLAALGFAAEKLGGYTVLEDQMVLGLNSGYTQKALQELRKTPAATAEMIVGQLEQKSGRKYEIIHGQGKGVGQWWWLMTSKDLDRLRQACMGGRMKITNWGFAF